MREISGGGLVEKGLLILIVFFVVNPFIKVIPIHVEIQPIYAFCICIAIAFRGTVNANFIYIFISLTLFMLIGSFITNFEHYAISTYLAVISLLLLKEFFIGKEVDSELTFKVIFFCFHVWLLFGLAQSFFPSILYASGIDSLLESLISRYSSEAIGGESARGIRILAPEPSYAAHVLVFFLFFLLLNKGKIQNSVIFSELQYWLYVLLLLIIFVKNGSTTLFMMLFVFISLYIVHQLVCLKRWFLFSLVIMLVSMALISFLYWDELQTSTRFGMVASRLLEQSSIDEVFAILVQSGGQRIASVYVGYWALFNLEAGYYFGYWGHNFYNVAISSGLDVHSINYFNNVTENVKPYSLASTLSFDLGVVGFILSFYFVKVESWRLIISKPLYFSFYSSCVFAVFFNSPVALPTYLFFIFYLNLVLRNKNGHC